MEDENVNKTQAWRICQIPAATFVIACEYLCWIPFSKDGVVMKDEPACGR